MAANKSVHYSTSVRHS